MIYILAQETVLGLSSLAQKLSPSSLMDGEGEQVLDSPNGLLRNRKKIAFIESSYALVPRQGAEGFSKEDEY